MGQAGRERARALYGSDAHAARVESVYESALRLAEHAMTVVRHWGSAGAISGPPHLIEPEEVNESPQDKRP